MRRVLSVPEKGLRLMGWDRLARGEDAATLADERARRSCDWRHSCCHHWLQWQQDLSLDMGPGLCLKRLALRGYGLELVLDQVPFVPQHAHGEVLVDDLLAGLQEGKGWVGVYLSVGVRSRNWWSRVSHPPRPPQLERPRLKWRGGLLVGETEGMASCCPQRSASDRCPGRFVHPSSEIATWTASTASSFTGWRKLDLITI